MKHFRVFNPEHDMALANGDRHFIAPRNIREMARDLAPLLEIVDSDGIMVWGWDYAVKTQLLRMGVTEGELPTDGVLTALRVCSERQSAHRLLRAFHADHPDGPYIGESIIAHSLDTIASYAAQHGHIILKDPLSSSGKGLRHVNINEDDNDNENFQRVASSSPSLSKVKNWINALIKRHGYLTAEPFYNKVQDFAMEFSLRNGQCHFIGYSLFNTNHHGRYESNLLLADEEIENRLAQYIPHATLHEVRDWIISHSTHIIPTEWNTTEHPLYFGIDMMVVKDGRQCTIDNPRFRNQDSEFINQNSEIRNQKSEIRIQKSEIKSQKSEIKLHPCVEINLRLNMGIIAHEVRRKLLAPGTEGTFHVTAFPTEEAAQQFHQEQTTKYPPVYREGKIVSGHHPLTPIHPHTRHHAYVICG